MEDYRCVEAYFEKTGDGRCPGTFASNPPEMFLEQAKRLNLSFYREMSEDIRRKAGAAKPVSLKEVGVSQK